MMGGLAVLLSHFHKILAMLYCLVRKIEKIQSSCYLKDGKSNDRSLEDQ